jgi:adenylate cyclase
VTRALPTVARCLEIMKKVSEEHGGRVVKTIGDASMAVFPLPANAAYAAIAMQVQISAERTTKGAPLAIHAGFHFGPIIDDNKDVYGDSVNVAARLSSLAKAGQTLVSLETVEVLSPALRARTRATRMRTRCAASWPISGRLSSSGGVRGKS